jgi:predicted ATP-grasp superfamily ATP-dependent carboligase
MYSAVRDDFAALPGVEVVVLTEASGSEEIEFRRLASHSDFTVVIAPEFDDILLTRCRWVLDCGGRLLGPTLDAVKLTADKWALADHLRKHGIPTPPCWRLGFASEPPPWVCKPRFGAGSLATRVIRDHVELAAFLELSRKTGWNSEHIVQPIVPGLPASVAFLIGRNASVALTPTAQDLSSDGQLRYCGGFLPLPPPLAERALQLTQSAIRCVPGLSGFVGVDVVLGGAADASEDYIIEINPRLTTSYIGLRVLAKVNLANALLQIALGEEFPIIDWNAGMVRFTAAGAVCHTTAN